jgi:hypothetical protein
VIVGALVGTAVGILALWLNPQVMALIQAWLK